MMSTKILDKPQVLSHTHIGERYVLEMLVAKDAVNERDIIRRFEWGAIPQATETTPPEAYAEVHDRPLQPGEEVVTEEEYKYLQLCEARDVLEIELSDPEIRARFEEIPIGDSF